MLLSLAKKLKRFASASIKCILFYFQENAEFQDTVADLCKGRPPNEYFRLTTRGDCRHVVSCEGAGIAGTIRLASVKCPSGLAFDLERQTCDWKARVYYMCIN